MTIVYQNYINNIRNGTSERTTKRGMQIVSTGIAEAIESGVKPKKILGKILEHRTPVKVISEQMIVKCYTLDDVRKFMLKNVELVWLTKAENDRIDAAGHKESIPKDGDRYDIVGIELHNELVSGVGFAM